MSEDYSNLSSELSVNLIKHKLNKNQKVVSIVLIGPSGSGKSRIAEVLTGTINKSGVNAKPITKDVRRDQNSIIYSSEEKEPRMLNVTVVDTIGIGDLLVNPHEIMDKIISTLQNNQINYIFLTLKFNMRIDKTFIDNMSIVLQHLKSLNIKQQYFQVILTHCDFVKQSIIEAYYNSLIEALPDLRQFHKKIFLSLPDQNTYDDEHKAFMQQIFEQSKTLLYDSLWESNQLILIDKSIYDTWNSLYKQNPKNTTPEIVKTDNLDQIIERVAKINSGTSSWKSIILMSVLLLSLSIFLSQERNLNFICSYFNIKRF